MGMGMNIGNQWHPDPVVRLHMGYQNRNFGNYMPQQPVQQSPISALLAQSLAAKPNTPTLAELFPNLSGISSPMTSYGMPTGILGQGQYGAGRFLGSNVMGNPSLTSTAMNTK